MFTDHNYAKIQDKRQKYLHESFNTLSRKFKITSLSGDNLMSDESPGVEFNIDEQQDVKDNEIFDDSNGNNSLSSSQDIVSPKLR